MNIMNSPNHSLSGYIGYLCAMLCAMLLAACGGGGGSAGTIPNQPTTTPTPTNNVRSVVITTSANTLPSSGVAGTEVLVTVLARDSGNNAVPGALISLSASSGALTFILPTSGGSTTPTPGVTDANGMVMARLSLGGDRSLRDITLNASSGSVTAAERPVVKVIASTPTISLTPSAASVQTSGSIKVTALVVDGNNNAIQNAIVNFDGGTGVIVLDNGNKTDVNGMVTATLTAGTNATLRDITVTASLDQSSGIATPATAKVAVVVARPTLQLTASSGTLGSSGAAGTEVVLRVLARDANNNVVPNLKINLSADSGVLSVTGDQRTNAQGTVTERLGTGGDPKNRMIKVTATATGAAPAEAIIAVSGTTIEISEINSVNAGIATPINVSLIDSSNAPLINVPVQIGATNGQLRVAGNRSAVTDSNGKLILEYTADQNQNSGRITVSALGDDDIQDLIINNTVFSVMGKTVSTGDINVCYPIIASSLVGGVPSVGQIAFSTTRGTIFREATCQNALTTTVPLQTTGPAAGSAEAYIRASSPGVATLVATLTPPTGTSSSTRGVFEIVAPLGSAPRITLQSDPSAVAVAGNGGATQTSTLQAVVRDKDNNAVKGAVVNFSITTDPSGGSINQPSVVTTNENGIATTTYTPGATATATNGVQIKAQIQGTSVSASTGLTVARRALFITAGTGNFVNTGVSPETYVQNFQVLVSDAAGQAVPEVAVTASAIPSGYGKGRLEFDNTLGAWTIFPSSYSGCANEDINQNGILDSGEDFNGNGRLEPGIPVAVTISGRTDAAGTATVSLRYARNLANWLTIDLNISAIVAGSEARYTAHFTLFGAAEDFNRVAVIPPGRISPFGVNPCNTPL